jgi:hypothetical protein
LKCAYGYLPFPNVEAVVVKEEEERIAVELIAKARRGPLNSQVER